MNMAQVQRWITEAVVDHPQGLSTALAEQFSVSRATAASTLRKLVSEGWLLRGGSPTRPTYAPGANRRIGRLYSLPGIDELFRVFTNQHPDVRLYPEKAVPAVQEMIVRVTAANIR